MYEDKVIGQLKEAGVDLVVSLPCDKNKGFTDLVHGEIRTIDISKEEDGVGICAGAFMGGMRPVMSIQSSGLGNMMNAMMSLNACYGLPLVVLASWRGVDDEKIEAQLRFNKPIPDMLRVYGIGCIELSYDSDIHLISHTIGCAFQEGRMIVFLIHPKLWNGSRRIPPVYPVRERAGRAIAARPLPAPKIARYDAIKTVMENVGPDTAAVSNLGVPSKEVYAAGDRDLNFYMTGSYGQATPIGLGLSVSSKREVLVIDGDGSTLCNWSLPVVAKEAPSNLIIVALDNGTFGSTGDQISPAYGTADIALIAGACGIPHVYSVTDGEEFSEAYRESEGPSFIQYYIRPGNSKVSDITLRPAEISERFMAAFRGRAFGIHPVEDAFGRRQGRWGEIAILLSVIAVYAFIFRTWSRQTHPSRLPPWRRLRRIPGLR